MVTLLVSLPVFVDGAMEARPACFELLPLEAPLWGGLVCFSEIHPYTELTGVEGQKLFFFVACLLRVTESLRKGDLVTEHQGHSS